MEQLLEQLAVCIERGKVDKSAKHPPDLQGQDGASELTKMALEGGITATEILEKALMIGMRRVGDRFAAGKAFIPDLLIAAKAMNAAMAHLKPYFDSGEAQHKGTVILGTVTGDLHDIGKNLVKMVLEGDGWKVVDLGTDAGPDRFLDALRKHSDALVGLSALLTTTMLNMETIVQQVKQNFPDVPVFVGGAPLSADFSDKIGADGYFPDPQSFARHIDEKF
ncbi:MAG TPA: cobalamin-binding protein [Calditrichaeota bacterium]|nr:cobalamin-binding protein [Calditrichota bacterium]